MITKYTSFTENDTFQLHKLVERYGIPEVLRQIAIETQINDEADPNLFPGDKNAARIRILADSLASYYDQGRG